MPIFTDEIRKMLISEIDDVNNSFKLVALLSKLTQMDMTWEVLKENNLARRVLGKVENNISKMSHTDAAITLHVLTVLRVEKEILDKREILAKLSAKLEGMTVLKPEDFTQLMFAKDYYDMIYPESVEILLAEFNLPSAERSTFHRSISDRLMKMLPMEHRENESLIARYLQVDICLPFYHVVIEVDGFHHKDRIAKDQLKDFLLQKHGYVVLRIQQEDSDELTEANITKVLLQAKAIVDNYDDRLSRVEKIVSFPLVTPMPREDTIVGVTEKSPNMKKMKPAKKGKKNVRSNSKSDMMAEIADMDFDAALAEYNANLTEIEKKLLAFNAQLNEEAVQQFGRYENLLNQMLSVISEETYCLYLNAINAICDKSDKDLTRKMFDAIASIEPDKVIENARENYFVAIQSFYFIHKHHAASINDSQKLLGMIPGLTIPEARQYVVDVCKSIIALGVYQKLDRETFDKLFVTLSSSSGGGKQISYCIEWSMIILDLARLKILAFADCIIRDDNMMHALFVAHLIVGLKKLDYFAETPGKLAEIFTHADPLNMIDALTIFAGFETAEGKKIGINDEIFYTLLGADNPLELAMEARAPFMPSATSEPIALAYAAKIKEGKKEEIKEEIKEEDTSLVPLSPSKPKLHR